jgi:flagellar assembly factor FliW
MATTDEFKLMNRAFHFHPWSKNNDRLQKAFTYVEQHFNEEIDIKDVAHLNLSVPSFVIILNSYTLHSQISSTTIVYKACLLLQHEKRLLKPALNAALIVPYFNKVFKTITKNSLWI